MLCCTRNLAALVRSDGTSRSTHSVSEVLRFASCSHALRGSAGQSLVFSTGCKLSSLTSHRLASLQQKRQGFAISAQSQRKRQRTSYEDTRRTDGLTQTAEPPDDDSGQEAAVSYVPLILSYAALSVFTAVNPNESADLLFGTRAGGHASTVPVLMRLVSTGFATASFISFTLKRALENDPISQRKFERLNLGLSTFATLNILLLVTSLVSPEGSVQYPARPGFWAAALVYVCTLLVSWGRYGRRINLAETVKKTVPGFKTIQRDVQNVVKNTVDDYNPNAYTVITLSLVFWGFAQVFVPWKVLNLMLRSEGGDENELLARLCGCSLITLLPSASYSLKEAAGEPAIKRTSSRSLNAGLATAAAINLAVLLPYMTAGRSGLLLGPFLLLWAATLATSVKNVVLPQE